MTIILDPTIRSLSEYLRLKERNKNCKQKNCSPVPKRPDTCPHCLGACAINDVAWLKS